MIPSKQSWKHFNKSFLGTCLFTSDFGERLDNVENLNKCIYVVVVLDYPFCNCSKLIWIEVSWAPPKPNGEKSSKGEKPLPLLFSWPKPLANSPNILRKSSSGLTFALYSHLCVLPNPCWEKGLCCCWCWPPLEVEPKVSYSFLFCSSLKTSYASEASYNDIVLNQYW